MQTSPAKVPYRTEPGEVPYSTVVFEVKPSTLEHPDAGKGLFLLTDHVAPGCRITGFQRPTKVKTMDDGLPHDCYVHSGTGKRDIWWDAAWDRHAIPLWYFINHGCDWQVNCKMSPDGPKGSPVWYSTRPIWAGQELFYDYGEPDPSWPDLLVRDAEPMADPLEPYLEEEPYLIHWNRLDSRSIRRLKRHRNK
jgi:hypothetical protein